MLFLRGGFFLHVLIVRFTGSLLGSILGGAGFLRRGRYMAHPCSVWRAWFGLERDYIDLKETYQDISAVHVYAFPKSSGAKA